MVERVGEAAPETPLIAGPPRCIAWHPDEQRSLVAVGTADGQVLLRDPDTGEVLEAWEASTRGSIESVAWSPDGTQLATASDDGTARIWDTTGTQLTTLTGHTTSVTSVAWSPDGTQLATASSDGTARIWDTATGAESDRLPRPLWYRHAASQDPVVRTVDTAGQVHDEPATTDLLDRAVLAGGLAGQLLAAHENRPTASFAVHVAGAWGSGKSSLVNFTLAELRTRDDAADWLIPDPQQYFDAWRESQVGPAWWSLLAWLRRRIHQQQDGRRQRWRLRSHEMLQQIRLSGLTPAVVIAAVVLTAVVAYVAWWAAADDQLNTSRTLVAMIAAAVALPGALLGVGQAATRFFSWRTSRGARLFQRTDDNPMEEVARHAAWLRSRASGPVVLVVDDLDRCRADDVVALLEAIQTLLRETPGVDDGGHPLIVIVAADDRWLHTAFEQRYADFADAVGRRGRPLGHLFLAKLFQLQLRVPALTGEGAVAFGRHKLGLTDPVVDGRAHPDETPDVGPTPAPTPTPSIDRDEAERRLDATTSLEGASRS